MSRRGTPSPATPFVPRGVVPGHVVTAVSVPHARRADPWSLDSLADVEPADSMRELTAITRPRLANVADGDRRRRMLYMVLLPAPEPQYDQLSEPTQPPPRERRFHETKKESP